MHGLGCVLGPDNAKPIADCAKAMHGHWPVRIRQDSASVFDGSSAKTKVVGEQRSSLAGLCVSAPALSRAGIWSSPVIIDLYVTLRGGCDDLRELSRTLPGLRDPRLSPGRVAWEMCGVDDRVAGTTEVVGDVA